MEMERRIVPNELGAFSRTEETDEGKFIIGRGIVYNVKSPIYWDEQEIIMPGAATEVLKTDDVRGLFNHGSDNLLGRYNNPVATDTMSLQELSEGTDYRILTNWEDSMAQDVYARGKRRDLTGSSFAFAMGDDDYKLERVEVEDGVFVYLRTIYRFSKLYDIGPVTFPYYPTTTANVRSEAENIRLRSVCQRRGIPLPDANIEADKKAAAIRKLQIQKETETTEIVKRRQKQWRL